MHKLKGDTLIEVALAIGIFSMVAITVVSVISASTSGAQSSLETIVTREELDAQAEALRFIHDSYVSGSQSKNISENNYAALWNAIKNRAVEEDAAVLDFNPVTCSALYTGTGLIDTTTSGPNPFILNIRQLGNPANVNQILIASSPTGEGSVFYEPTTYPRIIYGATPTSTSYDGEDLLSQANSSYGSIRRVEGIFITAVRSKGRIVSGADGSVSEQNAFYDFYIRSCWMPLGTERASTISTVVRLYDPAVITY